MTRRKRQLFTVLFMLSLLAIAVSLVLYALRQNINLFYSPTQIARGEALPDQMIRVGGMVVPGSVIRSQQGLSVRFKITDYKHSINITYKGSLPDLFREGQGIVAQGHLINNQTVKATMVLAKHDESYMPPEVKYALEQGKTDGSSGRGS